MQIGKKIAIVVGVWGLLDIVPHLMDVNWVWGKINIWTYLVNVLSKANS